MPHFVVELTIDARRRTLGEAYGDGSKVMWVHRANVDDRNRIRWDRGLRDLSLRLAQHRLGGSRQETYRERDPREES